MTNKTDKRPKAAIATLKRDPFSEWLIPPVMIPGFLALLVAAYVLYRAAA
jgi:hypothetical protein